MEKRFIHIKFTNEFFDGDEYDQQARLDLLKGLVDKIEAHGKPGEYCVFATPFDVECINDEQAIVVLEDIVSPLLVNEHLKDGLRTLFEKCIRRIDGNE